MSERAFYVTTPIYYISGNPHLGHAYTSIAADVLARYHRTQGDAFFLTGTDEHGGKVAAAAAAAGLHPAAWTDTLVPKWQALLARYDVQYDDFIRTTEPRHVEACVEVFERLKASGDVYLGTYEGWYCTNDETFWLESKLLDGRCPNPECRRQVQWLSEDDWFFALSKYRDRLLAYYRDHPRWVRPERAYNEMMATLEGGLDDLCISRLGLEWGVPLPGGGVMYVWLDALLNYITALDYTRGGVRFERYWPANVQLIGKEIARFHTIIWPAVLWALGLPAPELVFAHGWMTFEGEKMSKSLGNVVDPFAAAQRFGADTLRYFLLREAPFGSDFSFSEEKMRVRRNGDLGNDLGNLVKRSLAMLVRYRDGVVPASSEQSFGARFDGLGARVATALDALDFRAALETIWELVAALNRTIDERKPWELFKRGDGETLDAALYDLCEGLRWLAHLLTPFMPGTATMIWQQLGLGGTARGPWRDELVWGRLASGTRTNPSDAPLFPRMDAVVSATA
ncbi:MAG: methionine--tRNA ligase [Candidatus Eremiobacteraeota bacterium]|nr:methionine--tRNA ligase [Candidatus Eremiobacteraeota bacterium]MBC5804053.1 methionine--tRNA ligase [Candidatus Eremiobacteraeota bacterium]MBC5821711.1 methionine--tRNA ligase [Candidatus Eremiobacteraeota bacterium]